ncbi:hypothetical protein [Burkholderia cenocepacia]|uniref:hypothetical protein n=1 Tax=Burkholderia cenocepacia TaxID=95486 RepID=UPI000982DF36|nr:hypothetical protein [Burkholderia cenocepacia]AQQ43259.1 hypothetical protein A8E75_30595 [Burkholderia cenocepacia]ONV25285.1 hypothetical protein A8E74_09675 [Burkholderia cenocepacia]ONV30591.1 hypothetical protein A8E78_17450 [Burkholderia cenocepacia]ONV33448.1 hypothetical protein A8E77_15840 [Burkholderia cenocepacia]ONV40557.1 hypothetical protein A8E82_19555 [Burkholderia cenocepacia]
MNIALDFDGTFTEDPEAWHVFIDLFKNKGHSIFLITMRHPHEANRAMKDLAKKIPVVCTGRQAKQAFAAAQGININVWIDDNPLWILTDSN